MLRCPGTRDRTRNGGLSGKPGKGDRGHWCIAACGDVIERREHSLAAGIQVGGCATRARAVDAVLRVGICP